jgi:hypothetical protein
VQTNHTCYSTVLSQLWTQAVNLKTRRSVQGWGHQLLRRVGLAVGLREVSGGMVGVRARENKRVLSVEWKRDLERARGCGLVEFGWEWVWEDDFGECCCMEVGRLWICITQSLHHKCCRIFFILMVSVGGVQGGEGQNFVDLGCWLNIETYFISVMNHELQHGFILSTSNPLNRDIFSIKVGLFIKQLAQSDGRNSW